MSLAAPGLPAQSSGLSLWSLLEAMWEPVVGYPAAEFEFKPRMTPLSTLNESAMFITLYYAMIISGKEWMRHRKPFKLHGPFLVHNFFLSALSAFLLALYVEQLLPTLYNKGTYYAICEAGGGWTKPLVTLYYLNYLTKYVELLDTAFLILKKKPLTFLHCYHHGATALLCYSQLVGSTAVSWVPITLNLTVHVVMYAYYFLAARGIRVWWKEWVTRLQIAQFVIDLGFVYFTSYTYFSNRYWPWLPNVGSCAGEEFAALSGIAILSSYLVLFISFYAATYKKGPGARKKAATAAAGRTPVVVNGNGKLPLDTATATGASY
ncbi:GNS1/SUR4 family protein [Lasiosphaeria miniovina]|uniref:Elongation of fatty acids protein n=1 Tax=Lasiosphaeria miniovina TaxID=1954250 RepID=A0AA40B3X9_9PEZI|nr:GNS1/SUR4 family protein [Lasiosphaeria miniovina]KAK0727155.1 GNS1/SUR4 family protein [Lasiosphaeria miniovina]